MPDTTKKAVLLVGGGAVGAIVALNLEAGGLANVTIVLRSNYNVVKEKGYQIQSCDHGKLRDWRPSTVRNTIPNIIEEDLQPYDYIILSTKNIPDVNPTALDLVSPALPKEGSKTTLLLYQNGLGIEKPFLEAFPNIPLLSGISMIGSDEPEPGRIIHGEPENVKIGAFATPHMDSAITEQRAKAFVSIYTAAKKANCIYSPNVLYDRWRKLVFNACLNPICAITNLDTGRIRLADEAIEGIVKPAMREIVAAAKAAAGVELDEDIVQQMIDVDPLESYLKPSMQQDLNKGNLIEFENLLGEPLRQGKKAGVPMPTLQIMYQLAKAIQWRVKESKGLVDIPRKKGGEAS